MNLGAAEGHPAAVMDMSFANQALAAEYVAQHHAELDNRVYGVPPAIDAEVARLKLAAFGIELDAMTPEQAEYVDRLEARHLGTDAYRPGAVGTMTAELSPATVAPFGSWASPVQDRAADRPRRVPVRSRAASTASAGGSRAGRMRAAARSCVRRELDGTHHAADAGRASTPARRVHEYGGARVPWSRATSCRLRLRDRPAATVSSRPEQLEPLDPGERLALRRPDPRRGPQPADRGPRGPRGRDGRERTASGTTTWSRSISRPARSRRSSRAPTSTPRRGSRPDGTHARLARVAPPEHALGRDRAAARAVLADGSLGEPRVVAGSRTRLDQPAALVARWRPPLRRRARRAG